MFRPERIISDQMRSDRARIVPEEGKVKVRITTSIVTFTYIKANRDWQVLVGNFDVCQYPASVSRRELVLMSTHWESQNTCRSLRLYQFAKLSIESDDLHVKQGSARSAFLKLS